MSDKIRTTVALPPAVHAKLQAAAAKNGRSLSMELAMRLAKSAKGGR